MRGRIKIANIPRVLQKAFFWLLGSVLFILVLLLIAAQIPFVQNLVIQQTLTSFNEKTGKSVAIDRVDISWFDALSLNGLTILDYQGNLMVSAERITVDYSLVDLLKNKRIVVDQIELVGGRLNLVKYPDSLNINLVEWLASEEKTDASKDQTPLIKVRHINLENFWFSYNNALNDSIPLPLFDYGHFSIQLGGLVIDQFQMKQDTIKMNIQKLDFRDSVSGLELVDMKTQLMISSQALHMKNLKLETPHSLIQDSISLYYSGLSDLGSFMDSVSFVVSLKNCRISPEDLNYFASVPSEIPEINLTTHIHGSVGSIYLDNFGCSTGQSALVGSIVMFGLPKIDETFIDMEVHRGNIHPYDVRPFVGDLSENVRQLGNLHFSGRFTGFIRDFVAKAKFESEQGSISSDLNLKIPENWEESSYSGHLTMTEFNLGRFLKNRALVQKLNFDGSIDGHGLTANTAEFDIKATLLNSGIYGHEYQKITADGRFATAFFNGELIIEDTAFTMVTNGAINLNTYPESIYLESEIEHLDLFKLGFSSEKLDLSTKLKIDVAGLNFDSLISEIRLVDFAIDYAGRKLNLDEILLKTDNADGARVVSFSIPELIVAIDGNFIYSSLLRDFKRLTRDLEAYFDPMHEDHLKPVAYDFSQFDVSFNLFYGDIDPYLKLLPFEFYVSPYGSIEGSYYQRESATLNFFTDIDSIYYDGIGFKTNTLEVNLTKELDSLGILGILYASSASQKWRDIPETKDLVVEAVWNNNEIEINTQINQPANNSKLDLNTVFFLEPDLLACTINRSKLTVLGEEWIFNPENRIEFVDNTLSIFNLSLQNGFQSIEVSGIYSDSLFTDMRIFVRELDLASLSVILPRKIEGSLDGEFAIQKNEEDLNHQINSDIDILNLNVDGYYVGNLQGRSEWDRERDGIFLDYKIERKSINTIRLAGYYLPQAKKNQLELTASFDDANLGIVAPLFEGLFSNMKGFADGAIDISGNLDSPKLKGEAKIRQGLFKFDYLGTSYSYDGSIQMDDESITLSNFNLRDPDGNRGTLKGKLLHENFEDIRMDISLAFNKMQILNTSPKAGELYYGNAFATGNLQISGPLEDLAIKATIKSNQGTKIYIPLESTAEVEQKDYITFVNLSDTTRSIILEESAKKSISGMSLDFDLEVTPDAYVELIFDLRAGDIIRGRADGNINLRLNTDGQFEMFGDVSITEGAYNFTIPSVAFNKEFNVEPGSTISWYGDPYAGVVNLHATYRQMASISDYNSAQQETVSQRLPYLVILDLKGDMMSPSIDFQIKLDEAQASLSMEEQSQLSAINNNEQELKRQVFGLLILRKFLPENQFVVSGTDLSGSISEFLSNQFSYFISQVDENLEIDVDLAAMDANAFNTFQLRLSYTFLDGRLKITGGGGIPQASATDSESTSSFLGDWSLRYLLTQDGHFRIKAFSQTDNISGAIQRETGISFQYIKSFDDMKELLTRTRDEAIKNREAELKEPGS